MMPTIKEKVDYTVKELAKRRKAAEVEATNYQVGNINRIKRRIR